MNIFKRIYLTIVATPKDKLLHFIAGALIGLLANAFMPYQVALLTVLLAAVIKELYDYFSKKGTLEIADALTTFIGGVIAIWLSNIII